MRARNPSRLGRLLTATAAAAAIGLIGTACIVNVTPTNVPMFYRCELGGAKCGSPNHCQYAWGVAGCDFYCMPLGYPSNLSMCGGSGGTGGSTGNIRYVVPAGASATWPTPHFNTIQLAMGAAHSGDEIWVVQGTYTVEPGTALDIDQPISIYGGFKGDEGAISERKLHRYPSVLSCENGVRGDRTDNAYHWVESYNYTAVIDGFVVERCESSAFSIAGADFTVRNTDFIDNGLGMRIELSPTVKIENCRFIGNNGNAQAGAIWIHSGDVRVVNSVFTGNEAMTNGGAITLGDQGSGNPGTLTVVNSTFYANRGSSAGAGAIYLDVQHGNSNVISNSIFWGNTAGSNPAVTDHIAVNNGDWQIVNNRFEGSTPAGASLDSANFTNDPLFRDADGLDNIPGTADDDLQLLPTSTAIDQANYNYYTDSEPTPSTTDGDGNERQVDNPDRPDSASGGYLDIGALEWQRPIYVSATAGAGNNNGTSWANAYTGLFDALEEAGRGRAIWVSNGGPLSPTNDLNGDEVTSFEATFVPTNGVKVYGGFSFAHTDFELSDRTMQEGDRTWLNGDDTVFNVITAVGKYPGTLFDSFRITGGMAIGAGFNKGAAATISDGYLGFSNCTFADNEAGETGVDGYGGALHVERGTLLCNNCSFTDNTADTGGAIAINNLSRARFLNSTFTTNSSSLDDGGAIWADSGTEVDLIGTSFVGNFVPTAEWGGAVKFYGETLNIIGCNFRGNSSTWGGAVYHQDGDLLIANSVFVGNSADNGGAIYVANLTDSATVTSSTFYGNSATVGHAIDSPFAFTATNSIFAGVPGDPSQINGSVTLDYACGPAVPGTNGVDQANPLVSNPDPVNGTWGDADDSLGDLLPANTCVDAGLQSHLPADTLDLDYDRNTNEQLPIDFAGNSRVVTSLDIGAYESP